MGNPLKYTDPKGLIFIDPWGTIPDDASGPNVDPLRQPRAPDQLPYDPTYTGCDQYPCGTPESKALHGLCEYFDDDPNSNCARKCLSDFVGSNGDNPPDGYYIPQHPICWYECGYPGGWR